MDSSMYVALSAQVALERRLDTIAQNVANLATAGYRAEEMKFDTVLSNTGKDPTAFVSQGDSYLSRRSGPLDKTDNPLDVAVQGNAWFAISTPGGVAYTRDGRLQMNENGDLTTLEGNPILDVGRAPLSVNPDAGPPIIARDGMITQNGQQVGAIGLFEIDPKIPLDRVENSAVSPKGPATEVLDFTTNGVVQGFVEGSNVQPVMEISRLIAVTRAFDAANAMIDKSESTSQEAIKVLGDTT
jgi:flagellar basal-body rod protein FlgF